jgi:hypothetical protein
LSLAMTRSFVERKGILGTEAVSLRQFLNGAWGLGSSKDHETRWNHDAVVHAFVKETRNNIDSPDLEVNEPEAARREPQTRSKLLS